MAYSRIRRPQFLLIFIESNQRCRIIENVLTCLFYFLDKKKKRNKFVIEETCVIWRDKEDYLLGEKRIIQWRSSEVRR